MNLAKTLSILAVVLAFYVFYCVNDARRLRGFTSTSAFKYFLVLVVFILIGLGPSVGLTFVVPAAMQKVGAAKAASPTGIISGAIWAVFTCFLGLTTLMAVGKPRPQADAKRSLGDRTRFLITKAEPHLLDYDKRIRQELFVRQDDHIQRLGVIASEELGDIAPAVFGEKYKRIMQRRVELNELTEAAAQKHIVKVDAAITEVGVSPDQRAANLFALVYSWNDGQHFSRHRVPRLCREYRNANGIKRPSRPRKRRRFHCKPAQRP